MVGLRLDCSWVPHGFSLEFPWNFPSKCCLEFAWNFRGIVLSSTWVLLGISWNVPLECCLEFAWNFIGFCMDSHWNLHGIVLWSADWTLLGISSERPLALAFSGFWQKMVRNPNACLTHPTCLPLNHGWTSLGLLLASAWFLF